MRFTTLVTTLAACIVVAGPVFAEGTPPRLQQAWISKNFSAPEGVAATNDTLFISNVAGEATEKDGKGWISRVSKQGKILEEKWIAGLNGPKGMAIHHGLLYVADIDTFHIIDIENAKIIHSFPVDGAGFLNDVTVWNGVVYASDSARNTIHRLSEKGSRVWLTAPILSGVNGLLGQDDHLIVSTMTRGQLLSIDADGKIEVLADGMIDADGIARLDDESFLVSSWTGRIWHVGLDGTVTSVVDTESDGINQNDLTRVDDLIIVPNWSPGTVTAWRLIGSE